jgi:hypothetical protein
MRKYCLKWVRIFHETYGYDHDVEVERGQLIVEASRRSSVQSRIKKCASAATNYREGVRIESIEPYTGPDETKPLDAIDRLLDPYHSVRLA